MNPSSKDVEMESTVIIPVPVALEWNQLIQMLRMVQQIPGISEPERLIIDDFFNYVNRNFPSLNPYRSFGECQNSQQLLDRRVRKVLAEVTGDENKVLYHRGWGNYILSGIPAAQKAALLLEYESSKPAAWDLALTYSAGDTMNQARSLYRNRNLSSAVKQLQSEGWSVWCNFHLSFMTSNLMWIGTPPGNITTGVIQNYAGTL